jgi:curved DNA-binding protein CbpA
MSFEMTKGLFKYDFTDQHAILGVPLDAEFNDIRKRYMKIARRLHADTCSFESQADKDWANQFLSKVVNPAYNKFSKESDRKEYNLLIAAIGKRVAKEQAKMQIESASSQTVSYG